MSERRRLGRGLGALIPAAPSDNIDRVLDLTDSGTRVARRQENGSRSHSPDEAGATGDGTHRGPESARPSSGPPTPASAELPQVDAVVPGEALTRGSDPKPVGGPAIYQEVPSDLVVPNPRQPRNVFDEEAMAELVHSIREIGLLQPIVVRIVGDDEGPRYEVVAGERRLRACRELGFDTVPVIVRTTPDDRLLQDALLENLHRANLNPLEEAAAYSQLLQDFQCTQAQLAQRLGRSRPQVANTLRLLKLPTDVQRRVAAGVISAGHARALLGLDDADKIAALAARIVAEGLSVRSVEEIVAMGEADGAPRPRRRRNQPAETPLEVAAAAQRIGDRLDTRVKISMGAKKGRITVEFATIDDLARIVEIVEGATMEQPEA